MDDRLPAHATPSSTHSPGALSGTTYHSSMQSPHTPNTPISKHSNISTPPVNDYSHEPNVPQQYDSQHHYPSSDQTYSPGKLESHEPTTLPKPKRKLSKKWRQRLYWMVPLAIFIGTLLILFEVYRNDFERWVRPAADWLKERDAWSWTIPTVILIALSFPPLFGHEIVMLIVGLTYPIGVAIGIACAGAILGEAACFVVFKYYLTNWVEKKIKEKVKWAATARVSQEAGFRGVLIIRYSIVPPHLANPLFSCTGMAFWLYMVTVVLSLPKTIIFVILGTPASQNSKAAKWGKVVAISIVVIITIFASLWIKKKGAIAIKQIEAERAGAGGDEMQEMLNKPGQSSIDGGGSPLKSATNATFTPHRSDIDGSPALSYGRPSHRQSEVDLGVPQRQNGHQLSPSQRDIGTLGSPDQPAYSGYGRSPRIAVTSPDHSPYISPNQPPYPTTPVSQHSPGQPQPTPRIGNASYMTSPHTTDSYIPSSEQIRSPPASHVDDYPRGPPYPHTPHPTSTARIPTPLQPTHGFHTPRPQASEGVPTPTQQYNMYHTASSPGSEEPGQAF